MIDLILGVTNNDTKETIEYNAYIEPEGNGEIILHDDLNWQKFNRLIDSIAYHNYCLEVFYHNKIANATYELESNCIVISKDAQKRLLSSPKKAKKK